MKGLDIGKITFFILNVLALFAPFVLRASVDYNLINRSGQITSSYLATARNTHDISMVIRPESADVFTPLIADSYLSNQKTYWLRLDLADSDLSGSEEWIIRFLTYDEITLYYQAGDTILSKLSGKMHRKANEGSYHFIYFPIQTSELIEGRYLFARIHHVYRVFPLSPPHYWHPHLFHVRNHYFTRFEITDFSIYLLFIGGMMLMVLYSLGIFFMNRDVLFVYYAIYLLTLVLYLGVRLPVIFGPLEVDYPLFMGIYNEVVQVLVNITYLIFAASFLKAETEFPKLNKAIHYAIAMLTGVIVFQLLVSFSEQYVYLQSYSLQFQRYFMIVFTIAAYIHILRHYKSRIVFFLVTGSLFFLAGAVAAMVFFNIRYMMFGTAIEVFIFSLGMGYRIKLSEKEKKDIESEINKVKLIALRAQMNPHFIFNSLNAIRAYVISADTAKASDYLQKFSFLIRLILQYSSKDTISLKNEIDALSLYVQLEQLRFRENFNFSLSFPAGFQPENYQVPPLILQPYVENAIIHGLVPAKGEKKLRIMIQAGSSSLWINIKDNGVGRSYGKKKSRYNGVEHESMALELTRKRIDLTGKLNEEDKKIMITDLVENGKPAGTEVCIKLPLKKAGVSIKNQLS
jgi:sensor histidine kinase YesM